MAPPILSSVLLVRHADAKSRDRWDGADHLRPLTKRGVAQAQGLVAALAPWGIGRILTSPYVRCRQTVAPLADSLGVAIADDDALVEGQGARAALELIRAFSAAAIGADRTGAGGATGGLVLCSHGDVIPDILNALVHLDGIDLGPAPNCPKGCTWVLDPEPNGHGILRATYVPPPVASS